MNAHGVFLEDTAWRYRRRIFSLACIGFLAGIVMANTFGKRVVLNLGIFGDYFFLQLQQVKIDTTAMFWYVFEKRMFFVLVMMLFSVTSMGTWVAYLFAGWVGVSVGFMFSAAAMQQGIRGIFVCMAGLIPHYLVYVPAGLVLLIKSCRLSDILHAGDVAYALPAKKAMTSYLLVALAVCVVFFVGILMESLLNPFFLQKIYKFFNNM